MGDLGNGDLRDLFNIWLTCAFIGFGAAFYERDEAFEI
jgi:hypothetical protein